MRWVKREVDPELQRSLRERLSVDALTAAIFARRGIVSPSDALYYLEEDPRYLHNAFRFVDMEDAVDRILLARDEGEKVLVFGDRDVDGITSTALLMEALEELGVDAIFRLPSGDDAYGLTMDAVREFADSGGTLIITVDCGVSNLEEGQLAAELGVDLIVVDHHNPQSERVPEALAMINPKCEGSGYPFRDLAGCGVAYKLAWALRFSQTGLYKQQIALLNVYPSNDAFVIEAVRLSNLVETGRIAETIVPGMVDLSRTRLVPFLQGRQIFVWDAELQRKLLQRALGGKADVEFYDVRPDVAALIPTTDGMSLQRLREKSRIGRYSERPLEEIDVFSNLFISFALRKFGCYSDIDAERLQLVAMATIADMMGMRDENRILVKRGLKSMRSAPRQGIAELLAALGMTPKQLTAQDVSWSLSPAINAAGRMGTPELAVRLLLAKEQGERDSLASELVSLNEERKKLGSAAWDSIYPSARESAEKSGGKLAIVGLRGLHRGITGLIASRVAQTLKVPAVIASISDAGLAIASIRAAKDFDIRGYLAFCSDLLEDYGGHDAAAGFSADALKWDEIVRRSATWCESWVPAEKEETLDIDAELPHEYMTPDIIEVVDKFEPSGQESGKLVFMAKRVPVASVEIVGKKDPAHVKLALDFGKHAWPALYWNASDKLGSEFTAKGKVDAAFTIGRNFYNGMEQLQLVVLDLKDSQ
jgi:single-stranded-DNA-specific exonuclease